MNFMNVIVSLAVLVASAAAVNPAAQTWVDEGAPDISGSD